MSNNFIKRSGKLSDNSDFKLSDTIKIKILASDSEFSILAKLNTFLNLGIIFQSTSSVCMSYYIDAKTRASPLNMFSLTEFLNLPYKRLVDIARGSIANINTNQDFLCFYGYDAIGRGDLYTYTSKIKNYLISNVQYAIKNNVPKKDILKFYNYQKIPEIIRNKKSPADNDFYFAVGDGNYLYGQVHTLNERKREFQILYVLYDEYNWDDNVTYFIKVEPKEGPYYLVLETAAFKKLEKSGLAKPFLQFFIDTYTVSY